MRVIIAPSNNLDSSGTMDILESLLPYFDHKTAPLPSLDSTAVWNGNLEIESIVEFLRPRVAQWASQGNMNSNTVLNISLNPADKDAPVLYVWSDVDENWGHPDYRRQGSDRILSLNDKFPLTKDSLLDVLSGGDIKNFVWNGFRENLFNRWNDIGFPEVIFPKWWTMMTEKHRWYHTPVHIYQMLAIADAWKSHIGDKVSVMMAIFFHDLVYETSMRDAYQNEERSAGFLWAWMKDTPEQWRTSEPDSPAPISAAAAMINATRDHELASWHKAHRYCIPDAKIFLDIDMAILACKNGLSHFEKSIRREWNQVDKDVYNKKRIKFLKGLLSRKSIYLSDPASLLESRARYNLRIAVNSLEKS